MKTAVARVESTAATAANRIRPAMGQQWRIQRGARRRTVQAHRQRGHREGDEEEAPSSMAAETRPDECTLSSGGEAGAGISDGRALMQEELTHVVDDGMFASSEGG